jgi:hypothetical protein
MAISPKPLVVIFFRAPGGRSIYMKPIELTQRPTNPYMGWATPPIVLFSKGAKNQRAPSEDYTFFFHYYYYLYFYLYYYNAENEERNYNSVPRSSPFNACPINYNDPPIYRDGRRWRFPPKPLVVIFF